MRFVANLMDPSADPVAWARDREAEGWDMLAVSDHYLLGVPGATRWYPHVWVSIALMATATTRVRLTTAYANNLLRHPVEFAQASLMMQAVSGGRFEAGLGAGWARDEIDLTGQVFPPARERADRYIEAVQIVRALFDEGTCQFKGDHYNVDVSGIAGFDVDAPLFAGSLGGSRTIAGAAPLLDRVELNGASLVTRTGGVDLSRLATVPKDHLSKLVEQVRRVRDDVPLGMFVLCAPGEGDRFDAMASMFGPESLYGGFYGSPEKVANAILELETYGIELAQVCTASAAGFQALAPYLLGGR